MTNLVIGSAAAMASTILDRDGCDPEIPAGRAVARESGGWVLASTAAEGLTLDAIWTREPPPPQGPEGASGAAEPMPPSRQVAIGGDVTVDAGLEDGAGYFLGGTPGSVCDWNSLGGPERETCCLIGYGKGRNVIGLQFVHGPHG